MAAIVNFILLVIHLIGHGVLSQQQCPTRIIGSDGSYPGSPAAIALNPANLYLNLMNTVSCRESPGSVTSWTICFHRNEAISFPTMTTFGIFKRAPHSQDDRYILTQVAPITLTVTRNQTTNNNNLTCATLDDQEPVVLPGTNANEVLMIGVCVGPGINDDINFTSEGGNEGMTSIATPSTGGRTTFCSGAQPDLGNNQASLSESQSLIIHISGNVDPPVTTTQSPSSTSNIPDATTVAPTGTAGEDSPASVAGLGTGVIIGIVILMLLLLAMATALVIVVIIWQKRKLIELYKRKDSSSRQVDGVENAVYGFGDLNERMEFEVSAYEVPCQSGTHKRIDGGHRGAGTLGANSIAPVYEYTPFSEMALGLEDSSNGVYYSPLDGATITYSALIEKNKHEDIYGDLNAFYTPASEEEALYSQLKSCGVNSIQRQEIEIVGDLGSGQFGNVEKGMWRNGKKELEVALKTLNEGASEEDKVKFLQEAAIMAQFRHPNVITLYGVVSKEEPITLVIELMYKGNLREYLHTLRPDPGNLPLAELPKLFLSFSQQIGLGMQYLSGKGFVHRDLAARNILLSKDNVCKVADFGMSRDLADETYYISQGGKIPVRWTAPEALNFKKYSTASDVWSYGCLLYEIWSLGYKPFEGTKNMEVIRLIDCGIRLPPPPGCPHKVYEIMISCWNPVSGLRPCFRDVVIWLVGDVEEVLSIPQDALDTHQFAGVLGSSLDAGKGMYQQLQNRYIKASTSDGDDDYQECD